MEIVNKNHKIQLRENICVKEFSENDVDVIHCCGDRVVPKGFGWLYCTCGYKTMVCSDGTRIRERWR